jgi:hypothetical protein
MPRNARAFWPHFVSNLKERCAVPTPPELDVNLVRRCRTFLAERKRDLQAPMDPFVLSYRTGGGWELRVCDSDGSPIVTVKSATLDGALVRAGWSLFQTGRVM